MKIHLFAGNFPTREAAYSYTQKYWEPEPDASVSDEEYEAWEDRNPIWPMRDGLDADYLDEDFVETLHGEGHLDYVRKLLASEADGETVARGMGEEENTLVLIYNQAFDGHRAHMASTHQLRYIGVFLVSSQPF